MPLITSTPQPRANTGLNVRILDEPGRAATFHPLQSPAPVSPDPANASRTACKPEISVQREGDRVTGVRVQCSCGQVIELACVYSAAEGGG